MDRETLGVIFLGFVSLLVLSWFATSIVGWIWAAQRLLRREPLIAVEPRVGLRPGLSDLLFAFGCFIVCLYALQMFLVVPKLSELNAQSEANTPKTTDLSEVDSESAKPNDNGTSAISAANTLSAKSENTKEEKGQPESSDPLPEPSTQTESRAEENESDELSEFDLSVAPAEQPSQLTASTGGNDSSSDAMFDNPQIITRGIIAQSVASVLATIIAVLWMLANRIGLRNGGMVPRPRDFMGGLLGVILFLPPIYLLQGFLVRFYPYEHKILDMLKEPQAWHIFLAMGISTTLVAPICEEFFFRGLFQSWLESLGSRRKSLQKVKQGEAPPAETPPRWPIFFSSLLFAFAHFGQGPAPVSLFFLALGLGYLYRQTGNIWAGVFVHMTLNGLTTGIMLASNLLEIQP